VGLQTHPTPFEAVVSNGREAASSSLTKTPPDFHGDPFAHFVPAKRLVPRRGGVRGLLAAWLQWTDDLAGSVRGRSSLAIIGKPRRRLQDSNERPSPASVGTN
jgi:hypothetical protein